MRKYCKAANLEVDLLKQLNELKHYHSNITGKDFKLTCTRYQETSKELFLWMMNLLKENMKDMYESCEWGWDFEAKKKEMSHNKSRFLVAYEDIDEKPVAFSHFRFDMDHDVNVIYCYEIQVHKSARKQGLAKYLMQVLETLSVKYKMTKVILTVFNHNRNAMDFFISQGYVVDNTSPQNFSIQTFYSIMSKCVKHN